MNTANKTGKIRSVDICLHEYAGKEELLGKATVLGNDGRFFTFYWFASRTSDLLKLMGVARLTELRGQKIQYMLNNNEAAIKAILNDGVAFYVISEDIAG